MANLLEQIKSLPTSEVTELIDQVRATCICIDKKFNTSEMDEVQEYGFWNVKATFLPEKDGVERERVSVRLRRSLKLVPGEGGFLCNLKANTFEDKESLETKTYYTAIWISDSTLASDASPADASPADASPAKKKKKEYNFSGK